MKKFSIINICKLKENLKLTFKRFPITLIIILLTCVLFFILIHSNYNENINNNLTKATISLIITYFFSVGIYITSEKLGFDNKKKYLYQLISISFGIGFFLSFKQNLENYDNLILIILSLVGIISYIFISPFFKNIFLSIKQEVYYSYFYKISTIFLMSAILGILLFALGSIGINAIFELFDLNNFHIDKIISDWAVTSLVFITPIFALTQISEIEKLEKDNFIENHFFSFLVKYILIPFVYIYFVILYIYSIKVLLTFGNWPNGEVCWMVIGFSILGYLVYIFSFPFDKENKAISIFRKIFPFVVIPQIFMLAFAIGIRIFQYDLTINRYFVVIFGIWLLLISIYYIFSKQKSLSFIPTLLIIFTIIISVGPWSVYSLPSTRQYNKLILDLKKANILQNNKIIPLNNYDDINENLSKNIYTEISYLCNYNDCNLIKNLFIERYNNFIIENKKEFEKNKEENLKTYKNDKTTLKQIENETYIEPSSWDIVYDITNYIKVRFYNYDNKDEKYIYFYINNYNGLFPIDTTGYTKIYNLTQETNSDKKDLENENTLSSYVTINLNTKNIKIIKDNKTTETIDISPIIEQLYSKYKKDKNTKLSKEQLTFDIKGKNGNYKLLFENIYINNPDYSKKDDGNDDTKYTTSSVYASGFLLIK